MIVKIKTAIVTSGRIKVDHHSGVYRCETYTTTIEKTAPNNCIGAMRTE
jgi:hypothetical protein